MNLAIIGLGYVGLPLAVEFGKRFPTPTLGFDIDARRIHELREGRDRTGETTQEELAAASRGLDSLANANSVVFDVKAALPAGKYDGRL